LTWIHDNCGFTISAFDEAALQRRFDKKDRHRIQKDVFVSFLGATPE